MVMQMYMNMLCVISFEMYGRGPEYKQHVRISTAKYCVLSSKTRDAFKSHFSS